MEHRRSGHLEEEKVGKQQTDVNGHVPLGLILSSSAGLCGHTSRRPIIELDLISKLDQKPLLLAGDDEKAGQVVAVDGCGRLFTCYTCRKTFLTSQALGDHQKFHRRDHVVGKHTTAGAGDADHYQPFPPPAVPRQQLPPVLPADIRRPNLPYSFPPANVSIDDLHSTLERMAAASERAGGGGGGRAVGAARFRIARGSTGGPPTTLDMVESAVELAGGDDGCHSAGAARFRIAPGGAGGPPAMMDRMAAAVKLAGSENGGHAVGGARFRAAPDGARDVPAMLGLPAGGSVGNEVPQAP